MATPRKLSTPLVPKRWLVTLAVVDTPGPGEDYLGKDDILANVLRRASHAGVEILSEHAEEDTRPLAPAENYEETSVMWPVEEDSPPAAAPAVAAPALTTLRPSSWEKISHWLGSGKRRR